MAVTDSEGRRGAKTLDKGLQILEHLAQSRDGLTVSEVAAAIGVHRTVATRLLVTLTDRGYVDRREDRRYTVAVKILELGRAVNADLRAVATPAMSQLAEELDATAVLTVQDGTEAVVIAIAEPEGARMRLTFKLGSRHPINRGAEAFAILAGQPPAPKERPEVARARRDGYAVSAGEVEPGTWGLAAPIAPPDQPAHASLAIIALHPMDEALAAKAVIAAAHRIGRGL